MTSYRVIVNPVSGRGQALRRAERLRDGRGRESRIELAETTGRGSAADLAADAADRFDRVVAVGGDGTLNEVLSGLMRLRRSADDLPELAFLASGTANAATRALGLVSDPAPLARSLGRVRGRPIDVGIVETASGSRPFLLWFGAGYDAVVIDALNRTRTGFMGIAGLIHHVPTVLSALARYGAPELVVEAEGAPPVVALSAIVANVGEIAFGGNVARSADPFDGRLDLVEVTRKGGAAFAEMSVAMLASSLADAEGVQHRRVTRVSLRSSGEVPFQVDGEPAGSLPAEVRVAPGAVRFLCT